METPSELANTVVAELKQHQTEQHVDGNDVVEGTETKLETETHEVQNAIEMEQTHDVQQIPTTTTTNTTETDMEENTKTEEEEESGTINVTSDAVVGDSETVVEALYKPAALPEGDLDDLAKLTSLDENTLLYELNMRYNKDRIYTYVSDILIAVNPFKDLPLYTPEVAAKYNNISLHDEAPHVYAIADACYSNLFTMRKNQCAIISGESGAGKTVSAKHIIRHIIDLSCADSNARDLEDKIIEVSPLLEALGNAQTTMNDNSSRFGKFTQLLFDAEGHAMGVQINEYLLEKSRVVEQHLNERNFHVFYYLFASAGAEDLGLSSTSDFNGLSGELWPDNEDMYNEFAHSLSHVGFGQEEKEMVHEVLAAVLHLTNVDFEKIDDDSAQLTSKGDETVKRIAQLLGIDESVFSEALTSIHTVTRGEHIHRTYTKEQCYDCRDAVAKGVYSRIFSWIVAKVNDKLAPELYSRNASRPGIAQAQKTPSFEIGVLDIFGFENFSTNSFEQLCINVAHEQLQFFFNEHTFRLELTEYVTEGIQANTKKISFVDNKPLIDMFLNTPIGIFRLLDEECTFPKATDKSFVEKIDSAFVENNFYKKVVKSRGHPAFIVAHFPGDVEYNGTHFLEKNKDNLAADIVAVMQQSRVSVIHDTFNSTVGETGQLDIETHKKRIHRGEEVTAETSNTANKRSPSLSHQFKSSLVDLVNKMTACFPHFVRCIKPNQLQRPQDFDDAFVRVQLGYTGVLEATRIRREGYSWRPTFGEFVRRFKILGFPTHLLNRVNENKAAAKKIVEITKLSPVHIGKTKLFLKWFHQEAMEGQLRKYYKDVVRVQSAIRAHFAKKVFNKKLERARMTAQERAEAEAREAEEKRLYEEAEAKKEAERREREEKEQREREALAEKQLEIAQIERERALAEAKAAEEERLKKEKEIEKMAAEEAIARAEAESERVRVERAMSVAVHKETAMKMQKEVEDKNKRVVDLQSMLEEAMLQASEAEVRALKAEAALSVEEVKKKQEKRKEETVHLASNMDVDSFDFNRWYKHASKNAPVPEGLVIEKTRVMGTVQKTGGRHRGWKKRWFVLDSKDKTFSYFDSDKMKKKKGTVEGDSIIRAFAPKNGSSKHTFAVETVDRTYFCKCSSDEETAAWVVLFSIFPEFFEESSYN
eukprot:m.139195 g.139195  ORF g.139195 m.139195 type:complete len:1159 (+) comp13164_c0_seq11:64-3540(+)